MLLELLQPEHVLLLSIIVFAFGLSTGSFLNVVIYRLPVMLERQWRNEAIMMLELEEQMPLDETRYNRAFPRSACPHCGAMVKAWQNIPVVSYLLLKGACHSCQSPISWRYPVVELLTGILSLLVFMKFGISYQFLAMLLLTYISIALIGIDYDHQVLPDVLTLPLLWIGLVLNTDQLFVPLTDALWGAVAGYGVLWVIFWLFKMATGKEGMGFGDFKLLAAYGAWFGWQVLPNIVLVSSLVGALCGLLLIVLRGRDSQVPIAFGPFIAAAAWLTVMYPDYVVPFKFIH